MSERTAGELLDERLKILSSGLYALARFLKVSLEDRKPSKPCASHVNSLVDSTHHHLRGVVDIRAARTDCN